MVVVRIKKRDGAVVPFSKDKIANAIFKAIYAVGGRNKKAAEGLADTATNKINKKFRNKIPTVEQVQDIVEEVLMEEKFVRAAKAYILYREKKTRERELKKSLIGAVVSKNISFNALRILKERYLLKDEKGNLLETPEKMFRRVAHNIALADKRYKDFDHKKTEKEFFVAMRNLDFLPNSPTLMNAGTDIQQLSACFVLPLEDSLESIYNTLRNAALIHQSGGGTGFSFSNLRPKGDIVKSTKGVSSGPLSFIKIFDKSTEIVKQGGRRRGANMGVLRVDHPDILEFITAKEDPAVLNNFNISVGITKEFMNAVEKNRKYNLINPRTKKPERMLAARDVLDMIATMAWRNGEPGVVFLDTINKKNPTPESGKIESTNPCGEVPLLPYESCNLGSINLANVIAGKKIDYLKFKKLVWLAVHVLDNVIDMNKYPLKEIERITRANRKIGLGVMGFADMLYQIGVKYDSKEGTKTAKKIMKFIEDESKNASASLAKSRGAFPNWKRSIYFREGLKLRNAARTSIAPTGTLSMIADTSSGIEPNFALSYVKHVLNSERLLYVNKHFENAARESSFYSEEFMKKISNKGSIKSFSAIPKKIRGIFVTSHDIKPECHVKMQAAFQKYVDNAVSKSVNLKNSASKEDVKRIILLAYKLGCKGITIYRHMSRPEQVLNIEVEEEKKKGKRGLKPGLRIKWPKKEKVCRTC